MSDTPADFLTKLIDKLERPYGAEKSIKIFQSVILSDRLLLTIHKNALGIRPEQRLMFILKEIGFPAQFNELISARLDSADIVHFGYENYGEGYFYKCYLEFAGYILRAQDLKMQDQQLVHYAIKWDPQNTSNTKFSYYHLQPSPGLNELKQHISQAYVGNTESVAYQVILEILTWDKVTAMQDDIMLLSVTEEGSERLSFDVNLYNADLCFSDISSQLMKVIKYFNVDMEEWARLYKRNSSQVLGHLAGGIDGNGREFFTVYFGVEERGTELIS